MAGGADVARYPGSEAGVPRNGPTAGGRGLHGAGSQSLLPHQARADRHRRRSTSTIPSSVQPLMALKATLTDAAIDRDAAAFISFLDKQKQTDRRKAAGVQGYCFSGPFAFHTAAVRSDRIRAVGTFHGGGLVTKDANSPHLLIPKTKASFVVAIARNDDQKQPDAKDVLKATFAAAKRPAIVEVYPADHGWCVAGQPDLRPRVGRTSLGRAAAAVSRQAGLKQGLGRLRLAACASRDELARRYPWPACRPVAVGQPVAIATKLSRSGSMPNCSGNMTCEPTIDVGGGEAVAADIVARRSAARRAPRWPGRNCRSRTSARARAAAPSPSPGSEMAASNGPGGIEQPAIVIGLFVGARAKAGLRGRRPRDRQQIAAHSVTTWPLCLIAGTFPRGLTAR